MNNLNVILVKIEDDKVITLQGEKYLVVDKAAFDEIKALATVRPYVKTEAMQESIFEILTEHPDIGSKEIADRLMEHYEFDEYNPNVMRGLLQRMKNKGLIETKGVKAGATWSIKSSERL